MILYNKSKLERYKYKFDGIENIETNYSQSYQDMFVLSMLNGKRNGTYLEIGAYHPTFISNTYLLEQFGWNGISVDIDPNVRNSFSSRKCQFVLGNALEIDYENILMSHNLPMQIDYLQLDIEPLTQTFDCLKKLPMDKYRFSVITYETDWYDTNTPLEEKIRVRSESRKYFNDLGYVLLVGDVESNIGFPYEDWYVDPNVISKEIIDNFKIETESLLPDNFLLNQI